MPRRDERGHHACERRAKHVLQRAGKKDHEALDDDDHVARDGRHLEGYLGAALIQYAEQDRGGNDADRMRTPHQRDGDADEAGAVDEVELKAVLVAHDVLSAIIPASAPEITMVTMMMRASLIPA